MVLVIICTHTCTLTGVVCVRVCWRLQTTESWNVLPYSFWRKIRATSEISQRLHERAIKEIHRPQNFFYSRTVHLNIIKVSIPTDAQVFQKEYFLKGVLKFTLKQIQRVSV